MSELPRGPVRECYTVVQDSGDPGYVNRILIGTATTGQLRVEWVAGRYGQIIPCNWSQVEMREYLNAYYPLRYQVDDAQNLIVKAAVDGDFEWLLLYEHDVIPPPDAFLSLNAYMREAKYPVVSGLYFTRARPSEPLLYRGRGTSFYGDWKQGDMVMVDGVPTGFMLVHMALMRAVWKDSEEYTVRGITTRRVFNTPRAAWRDPQSGQYNTQSGTSDLDWCTRVMSGDYFNKSGWSAFADKRWPFLVDTNIACKHINPNGEMFP